MTPVTATSSRHVAAPTHVVYDCIADYREHHSKYLPPAFSGFEVEEGGRGAGTVVRFTVTAGGRSRAYRMQVDEPEPGRALVERDSSSSLVTTYTVDPTPGGGPGAQVSVTSTWDGAGGIGGFFERRFAPGALRSIYADLLSRLDAYSSART